MSGVPDDPEQDLYCRSEYIESQYLSKGSQGFQID